MLLEMDGDSNICFVIGRCPGIGSKAQCALVLLVSVFDQPSISMQTEMSYLKHLRNALSASCKYSFNIAGDCRRRRYVLLWPSCPHQIFEPTIFYSIECSHALGNPAHYLRAKS